MTIKEEIEKQLEKDEYGLYINSKNGIYIQFTTTSTDAFEGIELK